MHMKATPEGRMTQAWWVLHALEMYEHAADAQDESDALPGRKRRSQRAARFESLGEDALMRAGIAQRVGSF